MKNNKQSLPDNLSSTIIGLTLGDASIYKSSPTSNSRIELSFGTKYEEFAQALGITFKDYMTNPVKKVETKGKNTTYVNYRLKTISSPIFNIYHDMFYSYNNEVNK
jgi:hypothetical protein